MRKLTSMLPARAGTSITALATPASFAERVKQFLTRWFGALQKSHTLDAYRRDLMDFGVFLGLTTDVAFNSQIAAKAAATLLAGAPGVEWGPGQANAVVLDYRKQLTDRGAAPNTVNRRLSMLRSLVRSAKTLGVINWDLTIPGIKVEIYRDTRGPGKEGMRRMLKHLAQKIHRRDRQAMRDYAIIRLLYDMGLRRGEVASLNLEHVDLKNSRLYIMGKARNQRQWVTMPSVTRSALILWLRLRTHLAIPQAKVRRAPLFFPLSGKGVGYLRLSETSIYRMVVSLGRKVGIKAKPHGLRHAAITAALDATNGDVRSVMKFSRHKKPETVMLYDDNRKDLAGDVARKVAQL